MIYTPPPRQIRYADAGKAALLQVAGAVVFAGALAAVYVLVLVLA